ncbi:MAG: porin [Pseudomonadota bacterium]
MTKFLKYTAIAAAMAAIAPAAYADTPTSKGGLTIKSDDGRFEANVGGRIHYDFATISTDNVVASKPNGPYLRRAYITLAGKAYGWKYKLEHDFAGGAVSKDIWIGRDLPNNLGTVRVGHMVMANGMEALTSSNDILFIERPFISNNTIYSGREYQSGVMYNVAAAGFTAMVDLYDANINGDKDASLSGGGRGYGSRLTYAPLMDEGAVVHLGLSYDSASYRPTTGTPAGPGSPDIKATYAGRSGPSTTILAKGYEEQNTLNAELAASFGPAFVQAEYAKANYEGGNLLTDVDVDSYYVQASFFVTGETKPYKAASGVFGAPKAKNIDLGAIELKARYDLVKSDDIAGDPKISTLSFGANYYLNPNVRFMIDYNIGKAEKAGVEDKPKALVARAQFTF